MAPNKTLYIREADVEVWERAEAIARSRGTSVSQLATDGLRATLPPVIPADDPGMEEIRVDVGTEEWHHEKAFIGRWLVAYGEDSGTSEDIALSGGHWLTTARWGVALTKRGKIAVFRSESYGEPGSLEVFDSLNDAEDDVPADILAEAAAALGHKRVTLMDI